MSIKNEDDARATTVAIDPSAPSQAEIPTVAPAAPPAPAPPPNGGRQAWLQVVGAFFLFFSSWGLVVAFGAYEEYLVNHQLSSYSPSDISWIGTVQGFLLIVVGVVTGPLFDRGYLRHLITVGTALEVLGLMTASAAHSYYAVFLSLGIAVGLGAGCLFVPSVAIVAQYFTTRRSAATGMVASGGAVGGVVFSIALRRMTTTLGWGWSNRVIGFIVLATLLVPLFVMKPRVLPKQRRTLLDLRAFRDAPYVLFSLALFFIFVGLYIPFFYVPGFAEMHGLSTNLSFYTVAVLNAGSFFGRLVPNILADKFGAWQVLLPVTFMTGIFAFIWIGITNTAGIIIFCVFYGFFSGAVISIPPSALVVICPSLAVVGTRMGMSFSFAGLGLLVGSPVGGAIINTPAGYRGAAGFAGASVTVGCLLFALAWTLHIRASRKAQTDAKASQ